MGVLSAGSAGAEENVMPSTWIRSRGAAADDLVKIADNLLAAAPTALEPHCAVVLATFVGFRAELAEVDST